MQTLIVRAKEEGLAEIILVVPATGQSKNINEISSHYSKGLTLNKT